MSQDKLNRRKVVAELLRDRGDMLVVAGLGSTSWDCTAVGDDHLNFPLWGGMGSAAAIGLGLAIAQPTRRVLVVTGDGEMLMGLGSLATVAVQVPANLAIAVIDNEHYGETGMQATHTKYGVNLAAMARGAGIEQADLITEWAAVQDWAARVRKGSSAPQFAQIKVETVRQPLVLPPRDGALLKDRFRLALLGPAAATQ